MRLLIRMAFRDLIRNRRRTFLSSVAVVAAVAVVILGRGFIGGVEENIIRAQVDSLSAHIMIRPSNYPKGRLSHPLEHLFMVPPELTNWIESQGGIWTSRTLFAGRAIYGANAVRFRGIAFDLSRDDSVFLKQDWEIEGDFPLFADQGVFVSQRLAEILGVHRGDSIVLEVRAKNGELNALQLPIAGTYRSGNTILDNFVVFIPNELAQQLLLHKESVSHLLVRLPWRGTSQNFIPEIKQRLPPDTELSTWQNEVHDLLELQKVRRRALDVLVFVLIGMSAAGIANTILMSAHERVREIGTLRALGMTRGRIILMFIFEGVGLGISGGLVGFLVGGGIVTWYSWYGLDLSGSLERAGDLPMSTMLYLQVSPITWLGAFGFGVLVAALASVWPAIVATRMEPAEAVRADG